jgi:hypothetical protein
VFHVLYFTIVEAMFALDGNSYHREEIVQRGNDIFSLLQVNYVKRSSFDFITHLEFSSLALQI